MGSLQNLSILKGEFRPHSSRQLSRMFEEVANGSAQDKIALIYKDTEDTAVVKKQTYGELDRQGNGLARVLVRLAEGGSTNADGDVLIAVCMNPSDRLVQGLLAIWKAGAAYLPLDPSFPENRVRHILREAKPVLVLCDEVNTAFKGTMAITFRELLEESEAMSSLPLADHEQFQNGENELAIVMYTSGSTGIPKGVRLPYPVIFNRLQWQWRRFPYAQSETVGVFKTALTFVDSVSEIWGPLLNGLAIVVVPKSVTKDPEQLVQTLDEYQIERLVLVPSLLRSLLLYLGLEQNPKLLRFLKIWVCSGEPLPVSLAEDFFKYFGDDKRILCNFYGSTEVMGDVTFYAISSGAQLKGEDKIAIGVPVDNTILYLLDESGKPVPVGHVGELYVSGMNLAAGYVNGRDPDKFVENPLAVDLCYSRLFKTGDFARVERGMVKYEGRKDSQIKIRGHRVDLAEVERAVAASPGVDKAVVLCYNPGELDQAILAFVTAKADATLTGLQLEHFLQEVLTAYMVPQVIVLDSIPLLVNGKIDRQALLKQYSTTNNNDDAQVEIDIDYAGVPEDKMTQAKVLFETVGAVIGRSTRTTLSLQSNFYALGGNSLNSIYTVTQLRDNGYTIGISDFLRATNLSDVLEHMTKGCKNLVETERANNYKIEPLAEEHKADVYEMITSSFYEKADLEQWLMPDVLQGDYADLLDKIWVELIAKDLSFVICTLDGERIAVSLNFDARDEPEVEIESKLIIVFEFLEHIEGPVRDTQLPPGKGTILHSFMMATLSRLSAQENVEVMQAMEEEVLRMARRKGFAGILTTNTSPLTQQLGTDIYGYKVMTDYQVNQFEMNDKSRPFGAAPDSQRAVVSWKAV